MSGRRGWALLCVLVVVIFALLRGISALADPPADSPIATDKVVVVGVTGHTELNRLDHEVLATNRIQAGAVSVRPRYVGSCAAAGWATLGAGRRTDVAGRCDPQVAGLRVPDWPQRLAAAAAHRGDARLGTLADSVPGCVAAVGPGAALAAARPDGSVAAYGPVPAFLAAGARPSCPITLVDAGADSDAVIRRLARQRDVTLIVTGVGPAAGSADPALQVIYRIRGTPAGWLTSASTRRTGVVTLPDLTRTLIDFGLRGQPGGAAAAAAVPIDGATLQVDHALLTTTDVEWQLRSVAALSDAAPAGYATLGIGGAVLFGVLVVSLVGRRYALARLVLALATVLGAVMVLPGAVAWQDTRSPGLAVSLLVAAWAVLLTGAALLVARWVSVPVAAVGAAVTLVAFTVDAALGGVLQPGSLINSRPIYGLRWYGFGNVTFACYATAGLVLAGLVADRLIAAGHRGAAVLAVAVIGSGVVLCEGWPSMGSDFGGVLALTPGVLGMLLVLSGVRVTWFTRLAVAAAAVVVGAAISWLDWRRGVGHRSHLGDFVQRILDGDAFDVVSRKAVASADTIATAVGVGALVVGIALWWVVYRRLLPLLLPAYPTLGTVAGATLATAVLGTLLNDVGIYVWLTITGSFAATVASLTVDRARTDPEQGGQDTELRPDSR